MKKMNQLARLLVLLLTVFSLTAGHAQTETRGAYDRYLATYRVYQDALARNLPEDQIKSALENYTSAKSAYEQTIVLPDAPKATDQAQTAVAASQAADGAPPLNLPGAVVASSVPSTIDNSLGLSAVGIPPIPTELRGIVEDLWDPRGRKAPDLTMARLETFIRNNPGSSYLSYARYELAKAYEWLKNDLAKAQALLKQITTDPKAGQFASMAAQRGKYLEAVGQHKQWKDVLNSKYKDMNDKYASYRNYNPSDGLTEFCT